MRLGEDALDAVRLARPSFWSARSSWVVASLMLGIASWLGTSRASPGQNIAILFFMGVGLLAVWGRGL